MLFQIYTLVAKWIKRIETLQVDGDGVKEDMRKDFVGRMLGVTGQGGGKCYGKAIGEVDPSTLEKTTSLK